MREPAISERAQLAELALAFIGLLWLTHGFDFVLYEVFPKIVVRVFALALFTASIGVLWLRRSGKGAELLQTWPVWIVPLLAVLSILWSDAPDLTLRRSAAFLGSTCFAVFLATRFRLEEQIRLVAATLIVLAGISVLRVVFVPEMGLMDANRTLAWRGVFCHKNYLGRAMTLGALALLILALQRARWMAAGVVVCIAICLASRSASAIISMLVTLTAAVTLRAVQRLPAPRRPRAVAAVTLLASIGIVLAVVFADQVLQPLGRDSTLTGRIYIWQASLRQILARLWLGYGYGAVWYTDRPGISQIITHDIGFDPLTAHSGFFDLLLELGIAGFLALALPFTLCAKRAVSWIINQDSAVRLWPATYLAFFVIANVAESELVRHNTIFWVLFAATVIDVRIERPNPD